jgi:hypothetical protein
MAGTDKKQAAEHRCAEINERLGWRAANPEYSREGGYTGKVVLGARAAQTVRRSRLPFWVRALRGAALVVGLVALAVLGSLALPAGAGARGKQHGHRAPHARHALRHHRAHNGVPSVAPAAQP